MGKSEHQNCTKGAAVGREFLFLVKILVLLAVSKGSSKNLSVQHLDLNLFTEKMEDIQLPLSSVTEKES